MGLSIVISLFTIIVIVNAFNLIDGIDGLASGLAIVCSALLGVWFYYVGIGVFSILSFALAGSLTGFFFYNVFGDRHKLFLGDTGSLIVGLIIAVLIIKFNEINLHYRGVYSVTNAPAISFALIAVPLVDTLRVMTIRILQKRSPFSADKNHIHHRILYFYDKHIVVTCFLIVCNLAFFAIAYQLGKTNLSVTINLILIIMISITILNMPAVLRNLAESKKNVPVLNPKKSFFEQIFFWYG
jgi:UDP-N-acetylmuramyl pentapeptide phosphotransferase/UDP-N-acetylglucosamine-1-phosphate transferase